MTNPATIIIEDPPRPNTVADTRNSWRIGRLILVRFTTGIVALCGFLAGYSDAARGDSDAKITEFESSLRDYVRVAGKFNYERMVKADVDRYTIRLSAYPPWNDGKENARLERALNSLSYSNRERATAKINQAIAEFNFARSSQQSDLQVHSDTAKRALNQEWERKNHFRAVLNGFWISTLSAAATWIITSLLSFALAFTWWFLLDRLRDVSRALKG